MTRFITAHVSSYTMKKAQNVYEYEIITFGP